MNAQLEGRYVIYKGKLGGDGNPLTRDLVAEFPNIITNSGLNRIGTGAPYDRGLIGNGTATPLDTDTSLASFMAASTDVVENTSGYVSVDAATQYIRKTRVYRFAPGVGTGNISEVGVGVLGNAVFSRALALDSSNNPTVITKLADEYLDLVYELRIYRGSDVTVPSANISGTDYALVMRSAGFNSANALACISTLLDYGAPRDPDNIGPCYAYGDNTLGDVNSYPNGTLVGVGSSAVNGSYVNNSNSINYRYVWGLQQGNADIGGISFFTSFGIYQCSFTPKLPKTSAKTLTLDYSITWSRRSI